MRRALVAIAVAGFGIVAMYNFTVAGTMALQTQFGSPDAFLIVGGVYAAASAAAGAIWWALRGKSATTSAPGPTGQRDMQIVMLVEAVMLGYALARKGARTR
ncbi:MAG: hypothetical protein ACREB8_03755 [Pseudolabrys sp.]